MFHLENHYIEIPLIIKLESMRIRLFILSFFLTIVNVFSCTTFVLESKDNLIFGRNLDWVSDHGLVVVNKRGIHKTAVVFPPDVPAKWTSKYGSITFNQFGKEFPYGGINETGLVIEIMRSEADYPKPDSRPVVNELQWIQYQLDNSATIEEVITNSKTVRIHAVKEELHFLICDNQGSRAVLEYRNGKLEVFKGDDLPIPVLANTYYPDDLKQHQKGKTSRFATVAKHLDAYKTTNIKPIEYSFSILDDVALAGSWSIVYDIKQQTIYFKSATHKNIKTIHMSSFNFSCDEPALTFPILSDKALSIDSEFQPYDHSLNTKTMKKAMLTNEISLPEQILNIFYNYAKTLFCEN